MLAEFNHISLLICLVPFYFLLHEDKGTVSRRWTGF